jgi:hypothetical protein
VPRSPSFALGLALVVVLALGASPVMGQEPTEPAATPAPICAVLTASEIAAALGTELPVSASDDASCSWDSFASGGTTSLNVSVAPGALADLAGAYPDATATEIAGHPALVGADGTFLFVAVDGGILSLFAFTFGEDAPADLPAAILSLAETVLGRLPSIELPEPATPAPAPSFVGDAALVDLFPDEIGGQRVDVLSVTGPELLGTADEATIKHMTDALTPLGKTIDDLSVGFANVASASGGALIVALRVRGADATTLAPLVLPLFETEFLESFSDPTQTPTQVAGRDVVMLTDGPPSDTGERAYVYAKDDVVWLAAVTGEGLAIEEVVGALP